MGQLEYFSTDELKIVNNSVVMAEELVSNTYKLSSSQLLRLNYDVKTLIDLTKEEIVDDHFAQILRYTEKKKNDLRDESINDFRFVINGWVVFGVVTEFFLELCFF